MNTNTRTFDSHHTSATTTATHSPTPHRSCSEKSYENRDLNTVYLNARHTSPPSFAPLHQRTCSQTTTHQNRPLSTLDISHRLSLYYQNVRGLRTKSKEFFLATTSSNYDIIVLTETWLTENHGTAEYFPSNYCVYRADRSALCSSKASGGGVLIAVSSDLKRKGLISVTLILNTHALRYHIRDAIFSSTASTYRRLATSEEMRPSSRITSKPLGAWHMASTTCCW